MCSVTAAAIASIVAAEASIPTASQGGASQQAVPIAVSHTCECVRAHPTHVQKALTGLDDIGPDVVQTGVDLLSHERRRHFMNAMDALCVLCRQRRRRRHGIAAVRCDDLLVCLEAPENASVSSQIP